MCGFLIFGVSERNIFGSCRAYNRIVRLAYFTGVYMRMTATVVLLTTSLLTLSPPLWSQTNDSEYIESPTNTYWVTCGKEPPYRPRTAVSPVLISADKLKQAFARVA